MSHTRQSICVAYPEVPPRQEKIRLTPNGASRRIETPELKNSDGEGGQAETERSRVTMTSPSEKKKKMALDTVSHFFDNCRQKGQKGEETLQLIRENISKSIKKSSLGDCKL